MKTGNNGSEEEWNVKCQRRDAWWNSTIHLPAQCGKTVTKMGHNNLPQNCKEPWQMSGGFLCWHPNWSQLASSADCFCSSTFLQFLSGVI